MAITPGHLKIPHHHGQGFVGAALAQAQCCHGLFIAGIQSQMKSPHTLYRNNLTGPQRGLGHRDGITIQCSPGLIGDPQGGATHRAGIRLGMKAALGGIIVFPLAVRALLEQRHAGVDPIIGNAAHNTQARAAVGAVDKGITVTAIIEIKQFLQAIRAGGQIR